ncbi:MAG: AAA family ATPase [Spirochaetaceae bacterium]|jgi:exonuclease SbcC|nr:AAA family ATPase [Spirochaetaceae bacterium]
MRPRRLVLKNTGPFVGEVSIDFGSLDEIFLISGRTGSGKTTIFDALCFALYGYLPGSRHLHPDRLRSDHASEGEICSVTLDFALGSRTYRIERRPKQARTKKRGGGTKPVDEEAFLYKLDGERALPFNIKKSEINAKIKELIGLSAEEFCKIVLLPQGEFARFLQQNTSERREVLGKLFPVDAAVKVREKAADKVKELRSRLEEAERALAAFLAGGGAENFSARREDAGLRLNKAEEKMRVMREREALLRSALLFFEREEQILGDLDRARREYQAIGEEDSLYEEKARRLERARAASPLYQEWLRVAEYKARLDDGEAALAASLATLASAEKEALSLDRAGSEKTAGEIVSLRDRRSVLVPLLEEEAQFEKYRASLREIGESSEVLRQRRESAGKRLFEHESRIQKLEEAIQKGESAEGSWETARAGLETLKARVRIAKDASALEAERTPLKKELGDLEKSTAELEKRIPVLREEYENLEKEKEAFERSSAAAGLALGLRSGEPCPVCGSPEHPRPAPAAVRGFGIEERLPALRNACNSAAQELASKKSLVASKSGELKKIALREEKLQEEYLALLSESGKAGKARLPELAEAERLLQNHAAALNTTTALREEGRRAGAQIQQLRGERDALRDEAAESGRELAVLETRKKALEEASASSRAKYENRIGEWDAPDVGSALKALDAVLSEKEKAAAEYEKTREAASLALASARTGKEAAEEARRQAELRHGEGNRAFAEKLKGSPFPNVQSLGEASLSEAGINALENDLRLRGEKKAELSGRIKNLEAGLASLKKDKAARPGTRAGTEQELNVLEREYLDIQAIRDNAAGELAAAERDEKQYNEILLRREELAKETGQYKALSDDLSGNDKKKPAFDVWLLGRYLGEVSAYATKRLEKMSEGRYALILDREGEGARGKTGLDLAVFDASTGRSRPCGTLSGGESFMASISLALGLADSIQARSGGIRLDAVFIDEGFGSLDEASLDKALNILDELREHRMVGIISHVAEMRSRIPSRIEVGKTALGSKISIVT